eukprot:gene7587-9328_t
MQPNKENIYIPNTKLFINNEWVEPVNKKQFDTINPTTEEVICKVYQGDKEDVEIAVKAAREALSGPWGKMTPADRSRLMLKLADKIEEHKEKIAALETLDNGKPYSSSLGYDISAGAKTIRYFGGWADKIFGKTINVDDHNYTIYTKHEPVGVVGLIVAWNFPFMLLCWKLGPALAAGCTCVAKQSEITPLTALYLAELIKEVGFPPGVFNLVTGFGDTVGNAIINHMDIDKVSFTGSTRIGRHIMEAASKSNLKRVTLELGGKSPNIIFEDSDIDYAVDGATEAMFLNMGQCCCAGSRLYVQESIYERFLEVFTAKIKTLTIGNPFDNVDQGPLVSKIQFDRVMGYIQKGVEEGGRILIGGQRHGTKGYFVQPTILVDVKEDHTVCKEEIFGPVIVVIPFKTEEEVIKLANNSEYGLAAGLFTKDVTRALKLSNQLKAGSVWVNHFNFANYQVPFGGYKQSGFGKDLSEYAIHEYLAVKAVAIKHY